MSTWNYRIVKVKTKDSAGREYISFGLYEVYYDSEGHPEARTLQPTTFVADEEEGPDGVVRGLERALQDAKEKPLLDDSEIGGC